MKIWGHLVGVVRWLPARKLASFQYDKGFPLNNWDLSPIRMPISNGDRVCKKIGTSAGGACPKALIAYNIETGKMIGSNHNTF